MSQNKKTHISPQKTSIVLHVFFSAEQLSAVLSSPQFQGLRPLGRSLMARDEGDGTNPVARSGRTDTIVCRAVFFCFYHVACRP